VPSLSRDDVIGEINAARAAKRWAGIVKWEGRLDDLLEGQPHAACDSILSVFVEAHSMMDSESNASAPKLCLGRTPQEAIIHSFVYSYTHIHTPCIPKICTGNFSREGCRATPRQILFTLRRAGQAISPKRALGIALL
jgi:hypothetical protein